MDHDLLTPDVVGLWEDAHTDYGPRPRFRTAPAGLVAGDAEWRTHLAEETPNGWLLRGGSLLETLATGSPIYLMHTTTYLKEMRASRQLYQAAGCLVGALYCALLTPEPPGLRPHNLGAWLLANKPHTHTVVFEVAPGGPVAPLGIDYLQLGRVHLHTYRQHRALLTPAEDEPLRREAVERIRRAAPVLDMLLAAARRCTPADRILDQVAAAVPLVPFLGYLYFETVSEYLMLHSTSLATKACAQTGELNNHLYKHLAFSAVDSMGQLFDLALFHPDQDRLLELVGQIEPDLVDGVADYVGQRLPHLFACAVLDPIGDATTVIFAGTDFDTLARTAPGLLGQMLFRLLRASPRYPQLFPLVEQAKATAASSFWTARGIATPFNGVIPKGEIGLNLAWPAGVRAWTAEVCERGLLHPVEEFGVTLVPRLADLRDTALGRARFARTTT
ncbi:hypothetical protein ACGF0J_13785 [Nonomuraea sp. NPDC047897]|uniref:hypothetical protein n=1 Tax=Nonomuraea sp. NPDC047897 TaxID=3364346 RepID=UPI0037115699